MEVKLFKNINLPQTSVQNNDRFSMPQSSHGNAKKHFYSKNIFLPQIFFSVKKIAHEDFNFGLSYA